MLGLTRAISKVIGPGAPVIVLRLPDQSLGFTNKKLGYNQYLLIVETL